MYANLNLNANITRFAHLSIVIFTLSHFITLLLLIFFSRPKVSKVKVSDRSGARNYHFRDLQMIANDATQKSLLTATTLARPSIKHAVMSEYILKKAMKCTEICPKNCIISSISNGAPPKESMTTI